MSNELPHGELRELLVSIQTTIKAQPQVQELQVSVDAVRREVARLARTIDGNGRESLDVWRARRESDLSGLTESVGRLATRLQRIEDAGPKPVAKKRDIWSLLADPPGWILWLVLGAALGMDTVQALLTRLTG